ncbi:hypothetical protein [Lyticum sinuosum]|uniref:Uncharacterized protein n=1 Tax=Lyticum sinuosum TaxID=1332059 RepID=A0AAE4VLI1_9RICK|nr:hypothetical protein [Lyticum sinuosum]MDZ5760991.1 hypothetical protein [Lyticum sinuosum]
MNQNSNLIEENLKNNYFINEIVNNPNVNKNKENFFLKSTVDTLGLIKEISSSEKNLVKTLNYFKDILMSSENTEEFQTKLNNIAINIHNKYRVSINFLMLFSILTRVNKHNIQILSSTLAHCSVIDKSVYSSPEFDTISTSNRNYAQNLVIIDNFNHCKNIASQINISTLHILDLFIEFIADKIVFPLYSFAQDRRKLSFILVTGIFLILSLKISIPAFLLFTLGYHKYEKVLIGINNRKDTSNYDILLGDYLSQITRISIQGDGLCKIFRKIFRKFLVDERKINFSRQLDDFFSIKVDYDIPRNVSIKECDLSTLNSLTSHVYNLLKEKIIGEVVPNKTYRNIFSFMIDKLLPQQNNNIPIINK